MKHQVVTLLADFPSKGAAQQAHARLSRLAVGEHRLRTRVLERVPSQHGTATTQHQRNMRFLYQGPAFMQCRHVRPYALFAVCWRDSHGSPADSSIPRRRQPSWATLCTVGLLCRIHYVEPACRFTRRVYSFAAIAAVPDFYTQVLHVMNKMNLPPPFGDPLPVPTMAIVRTSPCIWCKRRIAGAHTRRGTGIAIWVHQSEEASPAVWRRWLRERVRAV